VSGNHEANSFFLVMSELTLVINNTSYILRLRAKSCFRSILNREDRYISRTSQKTLKDPEGHPERSRKKEKRTNLNSIIH
jgi:uncharacterized membrane protein YfhO